MQQMIINVKANQVNAIRVTKNETCRQRCHLLHILFLCGNEAYLNDYTINIWITKTVYTSSEVVMSYEKSYTVTYFATIK